MRKVTIKTTLIIILSLFAVWNLSWFFITTNRYHKFIEPIPKKYGVHVKEEDGYLYNVKKPGYLRFTGNLGITKSDSMDGLIIWPLLFGGYEYGIRLQKNGEVYEIYVDENMNPINKDDTAAVQKIEEYKAEVEDFFARANKMWNLK